MAYDGRFTSIKPVIESVYRDSGVEEINFETAIEDAAERIVDEVFKLIPGVN